MIAGTIISHPKFVFHDGGVNDKILISLGSAKGITVLAKTTSKSYRYDVLFGCQCRHRFPNFHLVQNCCCLPLPTWVCLNEYYEFDAEQLAMKQAAGHFRYLGNLPGDLTRLLVECATESDDISSHQEQIVRLSNGL